MVNRGGFDQNLSSIKECLKDNPSALFVETKYMDLSSTEMRKVGNFSEISLKTRQLKIKSR